MEEENPGRSSTLFEGRRGPKPVTAHRVPELLYRGICKLQMELDWLKTVWDQPAMIRSGGVDRGNAVSIVRQYVLAGVARAPVYVQQKPKWVGESDLRVSRPIVEEYIRRPFYGSREMVVSIKKMGHFVNRKNEYDACRV